MITAEEITAAYTALAKATEEFSAVSRLHTQAVNDLEVAKATAIYNGHVEGRNAEEREAHLRTLLAEIYAHARVTEGSAANYRLRLDLARLEVERVRCLLRIAELAAQPLAA